MERGRQHINELKAEIPSFLKKHLVIEHHVEANIRTLSIKADEPVPATFGMIVAMRSTICVPPSIASFGRLFPLTTRRNRN
jgi:hypothetical protein